MNFSYTLAPPLGSSGENKHMELTLKTGKNIIHMIYQEPLSWYPMKITFYLMMENDNLLNPRFSVSPAAMNFIDRRPVGGVGTKLHSS